LLEEQIDFGHKPLVAKRFRCFFQDIFQWGNSGEILFYQLETTKITFFTKNYMKIPNFKIQGGFDSPPSPSDTHASGGA